jgi:hypothetical protein
MPLSVRRAGPADAPAIIEFNCRLAQESEGKTLDPTALGPGVAAGLADSRKALHFVLKENVTASLTNAPERSRCPACGALITALDERCPSCEIAFVADGSQKWTLGTVGPVDGICLPPTEIRE